MEEAIIAFAEKEDIDVVFGSNSKVRIGISERYSFPAKHSKERDELVKLLKKHKKWDEVTQLDTYAVNKIAK